MSSSLIYSLPKNLNLLTHPISLSLQAGWLCVLFNVFLPRRMVYVKMCGIFFVCQGNVIYFIYGYLYIFN